MDYPIKPCPFCGGKIVEVVEGSTFRWWLARCGECGAQAGEVRGETAGPKLREQREAEARVKALIVWNERQPAADLLPLLRECLDVAWWCGSITRFDSKHAALRHIDKLKAAIERLEREGET